MSGRSSRNTISKGKDKGISTAMIEGIATMYTMQKQIEQRQQRLILRWFGATAHSEDDRPGMPDQFYLDYPLNFLFARTDQRNNYTLVLAIVRRRGAALEYASAALRDNRTIVLAAVTQNRSAFEYASYRLRCDTEIVLAAMRANGCDAKIKQHLPPETFANREIMTTAIKHNWCLLASASDALRNDREIVSVAVRASGEALAYASSSLRCDREIVSLAVDRCHRGHALRHASEALRGDRELVCAAAANDVEALRYAAEALRGDREFAIAVFSHPRMSPDAFRYFSQQLLGDADFVRAVMGRLDGPSHKKNQHTVLALASDALRTDRDFVLPFIARRGELLECCPELCGDTAVVLAAVANIGLALRHASAELRDDRQVVLAAVANTGLALRHASAELRDDRQVVLAAVANTGLALQYASAELRDDRQVVLAAVDKHGRALTYASAELRDDRQVVRVAVDKHGRALRYVSDRLRDDRSTVLTAVNADSRVGSVALGGRHALHFASLRFQRDEQILQVYETGYGVLERHRRQRRAEARGRKMRIRLIAQFHAVRYYLRLHRRREERAQEDMDADWQGALKHMPIYHLRMAAYHLGWEQGHDFSNEAPEAVDRDADRRAMDEAWEAARAHDSIAGDDSLAPLHRIAWADGLKRGRNRVRYPR